MEVFKEYSCLKSVVVSKVGNYRVSKKKTLVDL